MSDCLVCGKYFHVKPSAIKRGRGKYCSMECRYKRVIKVCEVCGSEFTMKRSHAANKKIGRYCSLVCRSVGYKNRGVFKGENNPNYIDGKCYSEEYVRRASHRRRVQISNNGGDYTLEQWDELCGKYDNRCLACDATGNPLTVDHIVPVVKGGSNDISNLQPLCKPCNSKKNIQTIDYR